MAKNKAGIDAGLIVEEPDIVLPVAEEIAEVVEEMPYAAIPLADVSNEGLSAACLARICPACPLKKEAEDVRLRALAELDNTRKRLMREKEEHARYAAESVISSLLQALDTFDLALTHAPEDAACRNFVVGVEMTRKLLLESLAQHGLVQMGALGESFDPAIHEAISMEMNPRYTSGQVCVLISKGYRLRDRLLRPAKVIVCKNED